MTNSDSSSSEPRLPVARRKQFRLTGPSPPLDPQRLAVRRDLADVALADRVFAQHYAAPVTLAVMTATLVRKAPENDSPRVASLAAGDGFAVLEIGEDWSWGRCCDGGCVGYVETAALDTA